MDLFLFALITMFATCVQGVSGMGFGMVIMPFYVAMLGPHYSVVWASVISSLVNVAMMVALWKEINWRRFAPLAVYSIPGMIIPMILLLFIPERAAMLVLGVLMLVLVVFSFFASHFKPMPLPIANASLGFASGVTSMFVSQAGPVMAAYAQATRWEQREFAATVQPLFMVMNVVVVSGRVLVDGQGAAFRVLPPSTIVVSVAAVIVGIVLTKFLRAFIKPSWARAIALTVAFLGSLKVLWSAIVG